MIDNIDPSGWIETQKKGTWHNNVHDDQDNFLYTMQAKILNEDWSTAKYRRIEK